MKFLVIGLGSMGKRRIRCLQYLGHTSIFGFDIRADRRAETSDIYGIKIFDDFAKSLECSQPDALIISVAPDLHHIYIAIALKHKIPFFVEASVVDDGMVKCIADLKDAKIVGAPSATLLFHPAITLINSIVNSGGIGKLSNVIYHSGQYLPDWHTYEKVSDYYVSKPATGGAREIVAFELTWLTQVFGFPERVCSHFRKTVTIPGAEDIDDTYNVLLDYENFLVSFTVDVVSRYATRRLLANGDLKQLVWDWSEECIRVYDPVSLKWEIISYDAGISAQGYHTNIGESMYIEEIRCFIDSLDGNRSFVNTLEKDYQVLQLLYALEESDRKGLFVRVS